jgi:hypothetical protein
MSKICEEAENRAKEMGVYLSEPVREKLSTYDDKTQVSWIVNPGMERLLQMFMSELLAARQYVPEQQVPQPVPTSSTNDTKPDSVPDCDSDDDGIGFGLFD